MRQDPSIGDVVLLSSDVKRCFWRYGLVKTLVTSSDGKIRAAEVMCNGKLITRAISQLYPLEVNENENVKI